MEKRLPNIYNWMRNFFTLTNSPHGQAQNYKAIDTAKGRLYAPFDGTKIVRVYKKRRWHKVAKKMTWQDSFFDVRLPNGAILQCVHGSPLGKEGKVFRAGQIMGRNVAYYSNVDGARQDHWHTAIKVNGRWDYAVAYMSMNTKPRPVPGGSSGKWNRRISYGNKYLIFGSKEKMITPRLGQNKKIELKLQSKVDGLRIRKKPTTTSKVVGILNKGEVFVTGAMNRGEVIGKNKWWYAIGRKKGWVSGFYLRQINLSIVDHIKSILPFN